MACPSALGYLWSIINFLCGLGIFLQYLDWGNWGGLLCWFLRVMVGFLIMWLALTEQICGQFVAKWAPLWNRAFLFMGCVFVFFCCWPWGYALDSGDSFQTFRAFLSWLTFWTGILYLIFGIMSLIPACNCCSIPLPIPLLSGCGCGGGGGGGSGSGGGGGSGGGRSNTGGGSKRSGSSGGGGKKKKSKKGISSPKNANTEMYG